MKTTTTGPRALNKFTRHHLLLCAGDLNWAVTSVANRPKIRPNNSKQPEFQTSGPRKIWAEFLAEFLIFPNIGRKQPELSKFITNIHNIHF